MLYRQIDDFLILNDDSIRIPKIISVFIKLFYSGTAIRSFLIKSSMKILPVSHVSPINCILESKQTSTTQIPRGCKNIIGARTKDKISSGISIKNSLIT